MLVGQHISFSNKVNDKVNDPASSFNHSYIDITAFEYKEERNKSLLDGKKGEFFCSIKRYACQQRGSYLNTEQEKQYNFLLWVRRKFLGHPMFKRHHTVCTV